MPNHDFQGAVAGMVANQAVDAMMAANTLIWEAADEGPAPTWTIFNNAALTGVTSHNDTPTNSWIGQVFYKYPGADLEFTEMGIWIPSGGVMIGQSAGKIGIQYNSVYFDGIGSYANSIPGATDTTFSQTLVAGWNWIPFSSPLAWTDSFPWVIAAYTINTHYQYSSVFDPDYQISIDTKFRLDRAVPMGGDRCWYAPGTAGNLFSETPSRFYGIDLRVREA